LRTLLCDCFPCVSTSSQKSDLFARILNVSTAHLPEDRRSPQDTRAQPSCVACLSLWASRLVRAAPGRCRRRAASSYRAAQALSPLTGQHSDVTRISGRFVIISSSFDVSGCVADGMQLCCPCKALCAKILPRAAAVHSLAWHKVPTAATSEVCG
jgi:hypothetical protein